MRVNSFFFSYFRLSRSLFKELLSLIQYDVKKFDRLQSSKFLSHQKRAIGSNTEVRLIFMNPIGFKYCINILNSLLFFQYSKNIWGGRSDM